MPPKNSDSGMEMQVLIDHKKQRILDAIASDVHDWYAIGVGVARYRR